MVKKRGQVTIFIIVGIIMIGGFIAFFLIFSGKSARVPKESVTANPNSFLATCLINKIRQDINQTAMHGGENKLNISFKFDNEENPTRISYLCYENANFLPCVNQVPLLFSYFEGSIKQSSNKDVKKCFDQFISSLKKQGYTVVNQGYNGFQNKIKLGKLVIKINAELTVTKSETKRYQNFEINIPTNIEGVLRVVQDIINKKVTTCRFSYFNLANHPNYDINKYIDSRSSTVIYSVKDRKSKEEFRFAVRGCVIPS